MGPALGRRRRRVRLLDERPRDRLSPQIQHPRPNGAPPSTCRRWCSATPATTSGSGVAFTRNPPTAPTRSTASSSSTRGRGRRRRRPHARARAQLARARCRVLRRAAQGPRHAREALPRRAGHRVHHQDGKLFMLQTATASAPPPPREVRHGHGEREAHRLGDRRLRNPADQLDQLLARSSTSPKVKSARSSPPASRPPRRRHRQDLISTPTAPVRPPPTRARKVHPRPRRDLARGLRGMIAAEGHPHPRAGVTARGARRPPDGQGLHLRRRRRRDRLRQEDRHGRRPDLRPKATSSRSTAPRQVYAGQIKTARPKSSASSRRDRPEDRPFQRSSSPS